MSFNLLLFNLFRLISVLLPNVSSSANNILSCFFLKKSFGSCCLGAATAKQQVGGLFIALVAQNNSTRFTAERVLRTFRFVPFVRFLFFVFV